VLTSRTLAAAVPSSDLSGGTNHMMNRVKSFCNASQEDLLGLCDTVITLSRKKIFKVMLDNNLGAKGCQFQIVTISYQNTHPGIFSSKFIDKVQKSK